MRIWIVAVAACVVMQPAFAQEMVQRRTAAVYKCADPTKPCPGGPTVEDGLTTYTASRLIEAHSTKVRVFASVNGEQDRGCQDDRSQDFVQKSLRELTEFVDDTFGGNTGSAKDRTEKKKANLRCDFAIAVFRVRVDGKEITLPTNVKTKQQDYAFGSYHFFIDQLYGSEFNGKTVEVSVGTTNHMATQKGVEVFVESQKPK